MTITIQGTTYEQRIFDNNHCGNCGQLTNWSAPNDTLGLPRRYLCLPCIANKLAELLATQEATNLKLIRTDWKKEYDLTIAAWKRVIGDRLISRASPVEDLANTTDAMVHESGAKTAELITLRAERDRAEKEQTRLLRERNKALADVEELRGVIRKCETILKDDSAVIKSLNMRVKDAESFSRKMSGIVSKLLRILKNDVANATAEYSALNKEHIASESANSAELKATVQPKAVADWTGHPTFDAMKSDVSGYQGILRNGETLHFRTGKDIYDGDPHGRIDLNVAPDGLPFQKR